MGSITTDGPPSRRTWRRIAGLWSFAAGGRGRVSFKVPRAKTISHDSPHQKLRCIEVVPVGQLRCSRCMPYGSRVTTRLSPKSGPRTQRKNVATPGKAGWSGRKTGFPAVQRPRSGRNKAKVPVPGVQNQRNLGKVTAASKLSHWDNFDAAEPDALLHVYQLLCPRAIGSCERETPLGRRTNGFERTAQPRCTRTGRVATRRKGRFPAILPVSPQRKCSRNPLHQSCPSGTTLMQPVLGLLRDGKGRVVRCAARRCKCFNSTFLRPARCIARHICRAPHR